MNTECEVLGLPLGFPVVGPECMLGIEINPFAAELARVSVAKIVKVCRCGRCGSVARASAGG